MAPKKIIFLRHADTQKDPNLNAALWELSDAGKQQADYIATLPDFASVDVIYVSEERKTSLTVDPLAHKLGKSYRELGFFNEVKRGDKFLTKEEFESEKVKQLEDLNYPAFGGESGNDSLIRFKEGVRFVSDTHPDKTILIVTHGTVLNIYFADLLNRYAELPDRWKKTAFGAYGIVEDGKVIRDLLD